MRFLIAKERDIIILYTTMLLNIRFLYAAFETYD